MRHPWYLCHRRLFEEIHSFLMLICHQLQNLLDLRISILLIVDLQAVPVLIKFLHAVFLRNRQAATRLGDSALALFDGVLNSETRLVDFRGFRLDCGVLLVSPGQ